MHAKDIETKTCPICSQIVNRRIHVIEKAGQCPHCGAILYRFVAGRRPNRRTIWVTSSGGHKELVKLVERHIRNLDDMEYFTFGDGEAFNAELNYAHVLLEMCGGEFDVAAQVVECFYNRELGRKYNIWYVPKSIKGIISRKGPIRTALAYAEKFAPSKQQPRQQSIQLAVADMAAG